MPRDTSWEKRCNGRKLQDLGVCNQIDVGMDITSLGDESIPPDIALRLEHAGQLTGFFFGFTRDKNRTSTAAHAGIFVRILIQQFIHQGGQPPGDVLEIISGRRNVHRCARVRNAFSPVLSWVVTD